MYETGSNQIPSRFHGICQCVQVREEYAARDKAEVGSFLDVHLGVRDLECYFNASGSDRRHCGPFLYVSHFPFGIIPLQVFLSKFPFGTFPLALSPWNLPFLIFPLELSHWNCPFEFFLFGILSLDILSFPFGTFPMDFSRVPCELSPIGILQFEFPHWRCPFGVVPVDNWTPLKDTFCPFETWLFHQNKGTPPFTCKDPCWKFPIGIF